MQDISYRGRVSLSVFYTWCVKCPFKDVKNECINAQKLKKMGCYK